MAGKSTTTADPSATPTDLAEAYPAPTATRAANPIIASAEKRDIQGSYHEISEGDMVNFQSNLIRLYHVKPEIFDDEAVTS